MGGKSSSSPAPAPAPVNPTQKILAELSQRLFNETDPIRKALLGDLTPQIKSGFLTGPVTIDNIEQSPQFASLKQLIESQFGVARDQALATLPAGGQLNEALSVDLPSNRANALVQGAGAIASDEISRRLALLGIGASAGFGGASTALTGTANAAGIFEQGLSSQAALAGQQAQADASKKGSTGQAVGTVIGASIKKNALAACWVAREIYGTHNPDWMLFRKWLITDAPKWLYDIYIRYGERFANFISDKPIAKRFIRYSMDRVVI